VTIEGRAANQPDRIALGRRAGKLSKRLKRFEPPDFDIRRS
jgi:hypothetical protein